MTTGIDYTAQYISLKPSDGSRSIAELVELERTSGYSDMTDAEISSLIEYKEYQAQHSAIIEQQKDYLDSALEQQRISAEQQRTETRQFFQAIINQEPILINVTGNEVD